ncbi:MAG: radical SAM family heme chaperone HemW [Steroidobacteraceae bacterium]
MSTLPPLALYVHMPWCVRKCPYCDFNSHRAPNTLPTVDYVDALLADLDHDVAAGMLRDRELVSIFMGGGTPSLFSPADIGVLLEGVRGRVRCSNAIEITMEANPGTIERGAFRDYRAAGVNRVSLGVQSFADRSLQHLGRIHSSREVFTAVDELRAAGLDNFNLDLMYALPQQTLSGAIDDLSAAIALQPAHLSHYELTLEPGTVFHRRPPPQIPGGDEAWDMQEACQALLAEAGYEQYEISAYARAERQCLHNVNYWRFGDYLGIGAGAHGKLTLAGSIVRTMRQKQPSQYLSAAPADRVECSPVPVQLLAFEFMLNVLRLRAGFETCQFENLTGVPAETIAPQLKEACSRGLMQSDSGHWSTTELGRRFLNDLQLLFLPPEPTRSVASS